MEKPCSRSVVFFLLCLMLVFALYPGDISAQATWQIWGPKQAKPKNYNQPPDRNEFQAPENGEFKASPGFFAARTDDERCGAIDMWLSSVRYEVGKAPDFSQRTYYWKNGQVNMEEIRSSDISKYATPHFRSIFEKSLPEFTDKDAKQVAKFLNKCSYQKWVTDTLERQFTYTSELQGWVREFTEIEQTVKMEKAETARKIYREKYADAVSRSGYSLAELIKETDQYRLYAAFLQGGYVDWCSLNERRAVVGVLFKGDAKFSIYNDDRYWKRFESEMLQDIKSRCLGADNIYVMNYVDGFYLDYDRNSIATGPDRSQTSDVLNVGVYSASENKRAWIEGASQEKLMATNSRRSNNQVSFRASGVSGEDLPIVSITELRENFRARQEKLDAEAKVRRERAVAAEAARKEEERKQYEAKIAQKKSAHLTKAAGVLKFYKKGALDRFDFTGYEASDTLQNIYSGNFQPFTGGYESREDVTKGTRETFANADVRNPFAFLGNLITNSVELADFNERRQTINTVFYAYHNVFKDVCGTSKDMTWTTTDRWVFSLSRNGVKVEGSEVYGSSIRIRQPFESTYDWVYSSLGSTSDPIPSVPSRYDRDFRKLLKDQGCASASVRHFETNLYLATEWLLPAQDLLKP